MQNHKATATGWIAVFPNERAVGETLRLKLATLRASIDFEQQDRVGGVAVVILTVLRHRMLHTHHPDAPAA